MASGPVSLKRESSVSLKTTTIASRPVSPERESLSHKATALYAQPHKFIPYEVHQFHTTISAINIMVTMCSKTGRKDPADAELSVQVTNC
jgi:hypothetical protein